MSNISVISFFEVSVSSTPNSMKESSLDWVYGDFIFESCSQPSLTGLSRAKINLADLYRAPPWSIELLRVSLSSTELYGAQTRFIEPRNATRKRTARSTECLQVPPSSHDFAQAPHSSPELHRGQRTPFESNWALPMYAEVTNFCSGKFKSR